jgi:hypothetical protein
MFVVPTHFHRSILSSAIDIPIHVIPESIDSICYPDKSSLPPLEMAHNELPRKILWFGYPESFNKSFRHLMPALNNSISTSEIVVITNGKVLIDGAGHRNFDERNFFAQTADCMYSLLSHFSYDNQLNTWIKSPNKLVTSIVRGLLPFASATPSYADLLAEYGLSNLTFKKPDDLRILIKNREVLAEAHKNTLRLAALDLEQKLSPSEIGKKLISSL